MKKMNKFFRNIDLRKFFGTIIGGVFFLCCVAYFTYAYYEWKSDETSISLTIHEADVKCTLGPDVNVFNIGPVLNLSDGVKSSFAIENSFTEDMAISVILDITSISDSLLNESFKWAIVQENESNFDYDNPIIEGSFKNFREGSNLITTSLQVPSQKTINYEFIVYIDGNLKNDINMMQNSMAASLTLGNCGTDYIRYDELTQFAFYSVDDNSLNFTYDYPVAVGDTYQGKTVTKLYTGYDTTQYNLASAVPWYSDGNYDDIINVTFLGATTPTSTAFWFNDFSNTQNMNLEKLDTSNVTTMDSMFGGCSSLGELNVSGFNTSNVSNMWSMFEGCSSLIELDLSGFNTSNVTKMNPPGYWTYGGIFHGCSSLKYLNISNWDVSNVTSFGNMFWECTSLKILDISDWDTSNVTNMEKMFSKCNSLMMLNLENFNTSQVTTMVCMFMNCSSLTSLDLSNFNTSRVTNMEHMFSGCSSLTSLDLSNFNTSRVTTMRNMFYICRSLTSLDLSNFNTSQVTIMVCMFMDCSSLTELDLSNFDTSQVSDMNSMFRNCSSLTSLDLSNFNTSQVTNMRDMFYNCYNLITSLVIMNPSTTYTNMFSGITNTSSASITLYYVGDTPETTDVNESTETLVDSMKGTNPRVFIGGCYGDYCTVEEITTPVDDVI